MLLRLGTYFRPENILPSAHCDHSETLPSVIALSDAVSIMLATLQGYVSSSLSSVESIIQLQSLLHRPGLVITCFMEIVSGVAPLSSDEQVLSKVYEKVQQLEDKSIWLRGVILEVLSRVSKPWLNFVGEWVGLHKELGIEMSKNGSGKGFVGIEQKSWIDDRGVEMSAADYVCWYHLTSSWYGKTDQALGF